MRGVFATGLNYLSESTCSYQVFPEFLKAWLFGLLLMAVTYGSIYISRYWKQDICAAAVVLLMELLLTICLCRKYTWTYNDSDYYNLKVCEYIEEYEAENADVSVLYLYGGGTNFIDLIQFAFMAGLDGCLRNGADIIVNTDADNQYCGDDIQKLIQPILDGKADMVIGERPIDETEHFSLIKKKLQHFGSWVVRKASNTDIPDAPSGFRAFSREAAMRINVVNDYTYTLETIVQAGRERMAITSVPVRTNGELRPSRLFHSIWSYVKKSMLTILRVYMMYKPLKAFTFLAVIPTAIGLLIGLRFLYYMAVGMAVGHVQSLILGCMLIIIGFLTLMIGLIADVIAANRKLLQDTQYHARRSEYEAIYMQKKMEKEAIRTYRVISNGEAPPFAEAGEG